MNHINHLQMLPPEFLSYVKSISLHHTMWLSRYFLVYSSQDRMWKEYPLIFTSPPITMSVGVRYAPPLSTFLYFPLSKNLPLTIPEFFCAGSNIDMVSLARQNETMNLLSKSSGTLVFILHVNLNIFLSLSTYLKKSLLGGSGFNLYT